jgi:signal peptidase I
MSRRLVVELATLAVAALAAFLIRSFVAAPYSIPSESMLPTLMVDDTLLVEKWRLSTARRLLAFAGRTSELPARGDIVVFRAPPAGRQTYVKRLIALPGDRVALKNGIVILNGEPVPRWRIADFVEPVSPNSPCRAQPGTLITLEKGERGERLCRYPRFAEMLPGGRTYAVLDVALDDADDMPERLVPRDRLFVLGDNRDRSADSRFPAKEGGAVGLVPIENLVGQARTILFSTDGTWRWTSPFTWRAALRHERIAKGL